MKTDNFNHTEKVLVLGAGQLGAAVLDALVPAVIERQGTVSVIIVSPAAWDEARPAAVGKPSGAGRRRSHLPRRRHRR